MTIALPMRDQDFRAWRALIAAARRAAKRLPCSVDGFVRTAKAGNHARLPGVTPEIAGPFRKLIDFGERWPAMDVEARADNAEPVLALAQRCAELIGDAPDPHKPARAARLPYADDSLEDAA